CSTEHAAVRRNDEAAVTEAVGGDGTAPLAAAQLRLDAARSFERAEAAVDEQPAAIQFRAGVGQKRPSEEVTSQGNVQGAAPQVARGGGGQADGRSQLQRSAGEFPVAVQQHASLQAVAAYVHATAPGRAAPDADRS